MAVGRTPISIAKVSGWPWRGSSPMSSAGSPTGTIAASSIAALYHEPIESRTASSSTASRPIRWITIGGGALPARKPGTRRLRPSWRAAWATRFSTSAAGTSASTRTRDSGSSVTDVEIGLAAMGERSGYRPQMPRRFAAWLVTGPIGHGVAGVADWLALAVRTGRSRRARRRAPRRRTP